MSTAILIITAGCLVVFGTTLKGTLGFILCVAAILCGLVALYRIFARRTP
ncbi:hypothetical protein [Nocardia sp. SC052]